MVMRCFASYYRSESGKMASGTPHTMFFIACWAVERQAGGYAMFCIV
ncbi:hypothetical protein KNP414_00390 [Paenibacillus mucilaginosus KNP414]|uniref:Uncharacterized protein n=1 Tax=Paenibacillus mucilaginosus (strain KNP414) TaxID=1036673 RepID=F8FNH8_PAEMK|nr:hypothetical protein KNP414_00390 [Paenibacillus mucilaginosus KNP414]